MRAFVFSDRSAAASAANGSLFLQLRVDPALVALLIEDRPG